MSAKSKPYQSPTGSGALVALPRNRWQAGSAYASRKLTPTTILLTDVAGCGASFQLLTSSWTLLPRSKAGNGLAVWKSCAKFGKARALASDVMTLRGERNGMRPPDSRERPAQFDGGSVDGHATAEEGAQYLEAQAKNYLAEFIRNNGRASACRAECRVENLSSRYQARPAVNLVTPGTVASRCGVNGAILLYDGGYMVERLLLRCRCKMWRKCNATCPAVNLLSAPPGQAHLACRSTVAGCVRRAGSNPAALSIF